jgi:two-component system sensor histidine kinase HydH
MVREVNPEIIKIGDQRDEKSRALDTILKFSALLNSSLKIEDVLDHAMRYAEEFIEAEASSIYELDEEKNELFIRLARGEKKIPLEGLKTNVGEGIAGRVVDTGEPIVIPDVEKNDLFSDRFDKLTGFKTRSIICVPLTIRDKHIGALEVLNKKFEDPFTQADLELLTGMAQQIAIALENAKLYQRLEEKMALTVRELKQTQEKLLLSERLAAIGNLVQGVAHEIRNPIMTIGGFAYRIKNAIRDDQKLQKYIDIILEQTDRLEHLVRQVRKFADVQTASMSLDNIRSVIAEVLDRFHSVINKQDVKIITEIEKDLPLINMDSLQLVTALSNIFENALESMPNGGDLELTVSRKNNTVNILIKDTGIGIDQEDLNSIYDPFFTSKTMGAGLGLTMAHQIIANHDGDIRIRSNPGQGTEVTIRLPIPSNSTGKRKW